MEVPRMNLTLGKRIRVVPVSRPGLAETYLVSEVRPDKSIRIVNESKPGIYMDIYPVLNKEKGY